MAQLALQKCVIRRTSAVAAPARAAGRKTPAAKSVVICSTGTRQRRLQNVEGEFFVDKSCIDCDTCRWMAPETFKRIDAQSAVTKQPTSQEERIKALQALVSCPTGSIRVQKPPKDILEVQNTFPLPIDEQKLPGIYHIGFHSAKTFGAASYLIVHPEGNIIVDSPRYTKKLARKIEMLGGARYLFLTHKDTIGDHEEWAKHLKCKRILHSEDVEDSTSDVEIQLQGEGPWNIATDIDLVHTPGHTKGSVSLHYKSLKALFPGDHFGEAEGVGLTIFPMFNQYSISKQLDSVRKFLELDFIWILPGHGRRVEYRDNKEKNAAIEAFLLREAARV